MAKKTKATKMTAALDILGPKKIWKVPREKNSWASKEKMGNWALRLAFVLNECGSKNERQLAIRKAKALLDTLSGKPKGG